MAGKSEPEDLRPQALPRKTGLYIDSSALVKLYLPEAESDRLDAYLRGRRDLMISELCITEVIWAAARRKREGDLDSKQANKLRDALLADAGSGCFRRLDITPEIHRDAERMLLSSNSLALRTLDALHIALALSAEAQLVITFDQRMADAAALYGLERVELA
jgi:predicted nucleic acid-binding protein